MYKMVTCYIPAEGTTIDELWSYHQEVHVPNFIKVAGPRLKKYVIHRVTQVLQGEPLFLGYVETWWDSEEEKDQVVKDFLSLRASGREAAWDDFDKRITGVFQAVVEEKVVK